MTPTSSAPATAGFATLRGKQYINLTTFRKNGAAVATPVWFAQDGERLFVMTTAETGKIKRIRNNGAVLVGVSDARGRAKGPTLSGMARVLPDTQAGRIEGLLNRKYGLIKRGFDLLMALLRLARRSAAHDRVYIEIVPGA